MSSPQNHLKGRGCGSVPVTPSGMQIVVKGEAAAAGGWMGGPGVWQGVVSEKKGGRAAVGAAGAAAKGCRTPCEEVAAMWRMTSFG